MVARQRKLGWAASAFTAEDASAFKSSARVEVDVLAVKDAAAKAIDIFMRSCCGGAGGYWPAFGLAVGAASAVFSGDPGFFSSYFSRYARRWSQKLLRP